MTNLNKKYNISIFNSLLSLILIDLVNLYELTYLFFYQSINIKYKILKYIQKSKIILY